MTKYLLCRAC